MIRSQSNDATLADLTYDDRITASTLPELRDWRNTLSMLFHDAEDHCQHVLASELSHRGLKVRREMRRKTMANARAKVRTFATMERWT